MGSSLRLNECSSLTWVCVRDSWSQVLMKTHCFKKILIRQSYILKVLVDYKNHNRFQALDFMFDQAAYNTTQRSKPTFASVSNGVKWIPKCITPFLQPASKSKTLNLCRVLRGHRGHSFYMPVL